MNSVYLKTSYYLPTICLLPLTFFSFFFHSSLTLPLPPLPPSLPHLLFPLFFSPLSPHPSPLSSSPSIQTPLSVPLGGQSAAEDLMESFGFESELEPQEGNVSSGGGSGFRQDSGKELGMLCDQGPVTQDFTLAKLAIVT